MTPALTQSMVDQRKQRTFDLDFSLSSLSPPPVLSTGAPDRVADSLAEPLSGGAASPSTNVASHSHNDTPISNCTVAVAEDPSKVDHAQQNITVNGSDGGGQYV